MLTNSDVQSLLARMFFRRACSSLYGHRATNSNEQRQTNREARHEYPVSSFVIKRQPSHAGSTVREVPANFHRGI